MKRLIEMNASEWYFIVIGCIMALAQGAVQPSFALIFGSMLGVSFLLLFPTAAYAPFRTRSLMYFAV